MSITNINLSDTYHAFLNNKAMDIKIGVASGVGLILAGVTAFIVCLILAKTGVHLPGLNSLVKSMEIGGLQVGVGIACGATALTNIGLWLALIRNYLHNQKFDQELKDKCQSLPPGFFLTEVGVNTPGTKEIVDLLAVNISGEIHFHYCQTSKLNELVQTKCPSFCNMEEEYWLADEVFDSTVQSKRLIPQNEYADIEHALKNIAPTQYWTEDFTITEGETLYAIAIGGKASPRFFKTPGSRRGYITSTRCYSRRRLEELIYGEDGVVQKHQIEKHPDRVYRKEKFIIDGKEVFVAIFPDTKNGQRSVYFITLSGDKNPQKNLVDVATLH